MGKKLFTAENGEAIVQPTDAASEEGAFTADQPEVADGERHNEDATGAVNEDNIPVAVPQEAPTEAPEELAGEKPGKGGTFVSLGNGRVRRV